MEGFGAVSADDVVRRDTARAMVLTEGRRVAQIDVAEDFRAVHESASVMQAMAAPVRSMPALQCTSTGLGSSW